MTTSLSRRMYSLFTVTAMVATVCATASAQVVDINPSTPTVGNAYANFSTDGNASFSSPANSSYNAFRKAISTAIPGAPTVSDDSNGETATWTNLSHGQMFGGSCCGNPGMFFGQSPSPTTYTDAVLHLGAYTETGNSNTRSVGNVNLTSGAANTPDSNDRRQYELRIGFTESPTNWIGSKTEGTASGTDNFDMWAANHGSDTIYSAINIGSTDFDFAGNPTVEPIVKAQADGGNLIDSSNHYIRLNAALRAQSETNPNFAAAGGCCAASEVSRNRWIADSESTNNLQSQNQVAPGAPTWEDLGQSLSGTITETRSFNTTEATDNDSTFDTGVGYNDLVDLSWRMEINDPGAAPNTKAAREVKFIIKAGDVEITQVFDPGESGSPADPNPIVNPTWDANQAEFGDGYFDWQNAYPVFYLGPGGGPTAPMSSASSMPIGFINPSAPGDADGDGDIDGADFLLLQRDNPGGIADWQDAYGGTLSAVAAVPEPSTAILLVGMSAGLLAGRRRR